MFVKVIYVCLFAFGGVFGIVIQECKDYHEEELRKCKLTNFTIDVEPTTEVHITDKFAYQFIEEELTFDEAVTACQNIGMHLAYIDSQEENDFIVSLNPGSASSYWIGLRDTTDGTFLWESRISSSESLTPVFDNNLGSGDFTGPGCVQIFAKQGSLAGRWDDIDCSSKRKSICKGQNMFNYRIVIQSLNFFDAREACQQLDMELASIDSADENALIFNLIGLADLPPSPFPLLTIGINDINEAGVYVGTDGSSSDFINLGEADNPDEHCIAIKADTGLWHDIPCETTIENVMIGFVCKSKNPNHKRASYITPRRNLVTRHEQVCTRISKSSSHECIKKRHVIDILPSELWMHVQRADISGSFGLDCANDRFCVLVDYRRKYGFTGEPTQWSDFEICLEELSNYRVFTQAAPTYLEAVKTCEDNGLELASIRNAEENAYMLSLIQLTNPPAGLALLVIGINDRDEEGTYVATDGTESDYFNWAPGEPNRDFERCIAMDADTGLWHDVDCETSPPIVIGFVCKSINNDVLGEGVIVQSGEGNVVQEELRISTLPGQSCHASQNRQSLRALEMAAGATTESNCWHTFAYIQTNSLCGIEDLPIYLTATRGVDILEIGAIRYASGDVDCPASDQLIRMCPTVATPKSG